MTMAVTAAPSCVHVLHVGELDIAHKTIDTAIYPNMIITMGNTAPFALLYCSFVIATPFSATAVPSAAIPICITLP